MKMIHFKFFMSGTFVFCLSVLGMTTKAQSPIDTLGTATTITGKVINSKDGQPIAFATVVLLNADSVVAGSILTNNAGIFKFNNISLDKHSIKVSFIGFVSKIIRTVPSTKATGNLDIGIIKLEPNSQRLKEVVITAHSPMIEQKIDRLVFNVDNSLTTVGGDVLDVLKVTPGVSIQDNQIGLIGKSSVMVMIDNRKVQLSGENLISFLGTLKASDIKSVEVITNPPAQYDAEGNSGILNITLKKAKLDSWNATIQSTYTQNTYASGSTGGSFNYNKDKLNFILNATYLDGSRNRTESDRIYYPDQFWNTNFKKRIYSEGFGIRTGVDYQINKSLSVGVLYLGSFNKPTIYENDYGIITNNFSHLPDSIINTNANSSRKINANSLNWHSDIRLDSLGKLITLNFDYFSFNNQINRNFITETLFPTFLPTPGGSLSTNNSGNQQVENYSFKADISLPGKFINLSLGGRISSTQTNSNIEYFNTATTGTSTIDNQSDQFKYNEKTQALYASANKSISKGWQFQVGLRAENTQTQGNSLTNHQITDVNYLQFFPTLFTSYKLNKVSTFSFNYGRRIERPGFADLNPFKYYSSTYSFTTGNPFLQPQYSNIFELKYNFKSTLYTTVSYLNETHGFGSVPFVDDITKVQYFMDLNFYRYNSIGVSEYYIINFTKWWESNNEFNLYHNESSFTSTVNLNSTKGWSSYLSTNNSFTLNKSGLLRAGINFRYQSPVNDLLYRKGAHSSLDFALKYAALKNNLQFSIVIQDILKKDVSNKTTYNNGIKQIYDHYDDSRLGRFSISYRIGNSKLKTKSRNIGNEEEKKRAN